jgi:hypothetical protein
LLDRARSHGVHGCMGMQARAEAQHAWIPRKSRAAGFFSLLVGFGACKAVATRSTTQYKLSRQSHSAFATLLVLLALQHGLPAAMHGDI